MNWERVLRPDIVVLLIPIAAILVGGAIAITKLIIHHRERIAMIEQGMNPELVDGRAPPASPSSSMRTDGPPR